jgi:hypothetical protein
MNINRWPVCALMTYASLLRLGEEKDFAAAVAAGVATCGAVRKNASFGGGKSKKGGKGGGPVGKPLADQEPEYDEEYYFCQFDLRLKKSPEGWTCFGWADTKESTASFQSKVLDRISGKDGPEYLQKVLEAADKLVAGRENVDQFRKGGAYMHVREACKAGRMIDLDAMISLAAEVKAA